MDLYNIARILLLDPIEKCLQGGIQRSRALIYRFDNVQDHVVSPKPPNSSLYHISNTQGYISTGNPKLQSGKLQIITLKVPTILIISWKT